MRNRENIGRCEVGESASRFLSTTGSGEVRAGGCKAPRTAVAPDQAALSARRRTQALDLGVTMGKKCMLSTLGRGRIERRVTTCGRQVGKVFSSTNVSGPS